MGHWRVVAMWRSATAPAGPGHQKTRGDTRLGSEGTHLSIARTKLPPAFSRAEPPAGD